MTDTTPNVAPNFVLARFRKLLVHQHPFQLLAKNTNLSGGTAPWRPVDGLVDDNRCVSRIGGLPYQYTHDRHSPIHTLVSRFETELLNLNLLETFCQQLEAAISKYDRKIVLDEPVDDFGHPSNDESAVKAQWDISMEAILKDFVPKFQRLIDEALEQCLTSRCHLRTAGVVKATPGQRGDAVYQLFRYDNGRSVAIASIAVEYKRDSVLLQLAQNENFGTNNPPLSCRRPQAMDESRFAEYANGASIKLMKQAVADDCDFVAFLSSRFAILGKIGIMAAPQDVSSADHVDSSSPSQATSSLVIPAGPSGVVPSLENPKRLATVFFQQPGRFVAARPDEADSDEFIPLCTHAYLAILLLSSSFTLNKLTTEEEAEVKALVETTAIDEHSESESSPDRGEQEHKGPTKRKYETDLDYEDRPKKPSRASMEMETASFSSGAPSSTHSSDSVSPRPSPFSSPTLPTLLPKNSNTDDEMASSSENKVIQVADGHGIIMWARTSGPPESILLTKYSDLRAVRVNFHASLAPSDTDRTVLSTRDHRRKLFVKEPTHPSESRFGFSKPVAMWIARGPYDGEGRNYNHSPLEGGSTQLKAQVRLLEKIGSGRTSDGWTAEAVGYDRTSLFIKVVPGIFVTSVARETLFFEHVVPMLSPRLCESLPSFFGTYRSSLTDTYYLVFSFEGHRLDDADYQKVQKTIDDLFAQFKAEGVVHNDERAANVLKRADGSLCIVDFGNVQIV